MGWTSYYTTKTNKECCLDYLNSCSSVCKKSVMKGNKFFALMENEHGVNWVLVLLTSRQDGQFFYKDIQANPYEDFSIPTSILKDFKPANKEDEKWLERQRQKQEEKSDTIEIGSIWKIKLYTTIEYGDGSVYKKDTEVFVKASYKNVFAKRKTVVFFLMDNLYGDLVKTNKYIDKKFFTYCDDKELIRK